MSVLRPIDCFHCRADLIWPVGPFKEPPYEKKMYEKDLFMRLIRFCFGIMLI
jgi:hypothetical protein